MDYNPENTHSFEEYKAHAPKFLEEIANQLKRFRDMGGRLHRGARVIFEFNWNELLPIQQKAANFGSYEAHVTFQGDLTPTVSGQRDPRKASNEDSMKANRVAMDKNYKQSLHILYRKTSKALRKLQRLETERRFHRTGMKAITESTGGIKVGKRRKTRAKILVEKKVMRGTGGHGETRLSPKDLHKALARESQVLGTHLTNREHDSILLWTRNKLRELIHPIEEEKKAAEAHGQSKPLVFRQYSVKRITHVKRRMSMFPAQAAAPKVKTPRVKMPKFYLALPDGNLFIYYPSGRIAFCQICHHLGHRRIFSFFFDDSPHHSMLASFSEDGQGCVYYTNRRSCSEAMLVNTEGGTLRNVKGWVTHSWRWSSTAQQLQSLDYKINEHLRLQIDSAGAVTLVFSCLDNHLTVPIWSYASILKRYKQTNKSSKEEQIYTTAAALKRRFQQTMQQYFRAFLIGAGAQPPDHSTKPTVTSALVKSPIPSHVTGAVVTESLKKKVDLQPESESDLKASAKPSALDHPKELPTLHLAVKGRRRHSSAGSYRRHSIFRRYTKVPLYLQCPSALRRWLSGCREGFDCRCYKKMPILTDFDLDAFQEARQGGPPQVLLVVIVSSQYPNLSAKIEGITQKMYRLEQRGRPSPCVQCAHDTFRLVMYDVHSLLMANPPLLVERNCAMPGMVLMYRAGKLLFGGSVFNGHDSSEKHLLQQIAQAHRSYTTAHFLPDNYKFSTPCLHVPLSDTHADITAKCQKKLDIPEAQKPRKGAAAEICGGFKSSPSSLRFLMNSLPDGECLISTKATQSIIAAQSIIATPSIIMKSSTTLE